MVRLFGNEPPTAPAECRDSSMRHMSDIFFFDRTRVRAAVGASHGFCRLINGLAFIVFLLVCLILSGGFSSATYADTKFVESGFEPTKESVQLYFRTLLPDEELRKKVNALIEQLGDDQYTVREAAELELRRIGWQSTDLITSALKSGDPEIKWRARRVLSVISGQGATLHYEALKLVIDNKWKGLADDLFATVAVAESRQLGATHRRAWLATLQDSDAPVIRKAYASESSLMRIAAIEGVAKLELKNENQLIVESLGDQEPKVQIVACRLLLNQNDKQPIDTLAKLLEHSDVTTRAQAAGLLRAATGQQFKFVAYAEDAKRQEPLKRWNDWLAANKESIELQLPLRSHHVKLGRMLICLSNEKRLLEYDAAGENELWSTSTPPQPWACYGLPNGHRLVGLYESKQVIEYDADGKQIWQKDKLPAGPTGIDRTETGSTLIACTEAEKVIEVNAKGDTIWEVPIKGRPVMVERLENGLTLVLLQRAGKVVEVDRDGKIVWESSGYKMPFGMHRLENGNTLLACMNTNDVKEINREGEVVWSKTGLKSPYQAVRDEDGSTWIVDQSGVSRVSSDGKETKVIFPKSGVSRISRF